MSINLQRGSFRANLFIFVPLSDVPLKQTIGHSWSTEASEQEYFISCCAPSESSRDTRYRPRLLRGSVHVEEKLRKVPAW